MAATHPGNPAPTHAPVLTLAHSPDPDDAFMWWPIAGKGTPTDLRRLDRPIAPGEPTIPTGRWRFHALADDIEALNRRAIAAMEPAGPRPYDITALSFRAYADVARDYAITRCGASFGEGFGPKVVCRADQSGDAVEIHCEGCLRNPEARIAIPGTRTTAFLVLGLLLGPKALTAKERFVPMPFDQVIGAVVRKEVDAGVVIHEGQLLFGDAGLRLVVDLGAWWTKRTGLPLPLGCNAIRRDLDERFGPGSAADVAAILSRSVRSALDRREEGLDYALGFALANAAAPGAERSGTPTRERVDRYLRMYADERSADMGADGLEALRRLYAEGAAAGLCPPVTDLLAL